MNTKFSIVVVCFHAGEKLNLTMRSILSQTYRDFEVIVKDGASNDGSIDRLKEEYKEYLDAPTFPLVRIFEGKDKGIYDAMNYATDYCEGEYTLFLNCGDYFYDENVLKRVAAFLAKNEVKEPCVLYGDVFCRNTNSLVPAPKTITGFTCYRNIPCHQACFYKTELVKEKKYNLEYRIRADYDHFLWCFYRADAKFYHVGATVASYEGGGYSEEKKNRKRDHDEHVAITHEYMSRRELHRYKMILALSLAPLRRAIAENPKLSGAYQSIKKHLYR